MLHYVYYFVLFQAPQKGQQTTENNGAIQTGYAVDVDNSEIVAETVTDIPENENNRKISATDCSSSTPRQRKRRVVMREVSATLAKLKSLNEKIHCPEENEDECDVFGRHIAKQLKKLSTEQCIIAQQDIQNLLTRAE
jgi:hypothetical protein